MKAFPNGLVYGREQDGGMELRDYFAAKAMPSLIKTLENNITKPSDVAKLSYQYADAMMKARENKDAN